MIYEECLHFEITDLGATIGMAYKDISRKGSSAACSIGLNNKSWGIFVSTPFPICKALHGGVEMQLPDCSLWRVVIYQDWAAGTLSFYDTHGDTRLNSSTRSMPSSLSLSFCWSVLVLELRSYRMCLLLSVSMTMIPGVCLGAPRTVRDVTDQRLAR